MRNRREWLPGAALMGLVAPIDWRQPAIGLIAFDAHRNQWTAGDKIHQALEERLAFMLAVMAPRALAVQLHQFHCDNDVSAPFQAGNDFADQAACDGIGFAQNERTLHCHNGPSDTGRGQAGPAPRKPGA